MKRFYHYLVGSKSESHVQKNGGIHERTSLLDVAESSHSTLASRSKSLQSDEENLQPENHPTYKDSSADRTTPLESYFFPADNPSIQRYYRFEATPVTPVVALYKRPHTDSGVTGLLRRSAVVPSHGTSERDWILVSVGGRSGWARRHPSGPFQPADAFIAHQAWMGNHAFLFKGKCMLGSDAPSLVLTNTLLLGCGLYHFLVVFPRLSESHTNTSLWYNTSMFLLVASFILLWVTACLDPGIIPARSSPLRPEPPAGLVGHSSNSYRYCSTCNIFRPPRSKHCNSCNVCVSEFDHHCPWTGNCIGERNHVWFVCFLAAVTTLSSFVTGCVAMLVADTFVDLFLVNTGGIGPVYNSTDGVDSPAFQSSFLYDKDAWTTLWQAISTMPVTVLFGLFLLLCAWSLLSLLAYHALLISVAQTTNERVRGVYLTSSNPRDQGCCLNCITFFTRKTSPSLLPPDFSKEVKLQHARVESLWSE